MRRLLLLMAPLILTAAPVRAADYTDGLSGPEVGQLVRDAMQQAGAPAPGFSDPARGFPACDTAPAVTPRQGDWATAELRCASPAWTRAFRTGASPSGARAARPDSGDTAASGPLVVTLKHSIARGAMIGPEDIELRPMAERSTDQIFTDLAEVVGRRTKASLGAGKPVLLRHLEPVYLIETGNPLVLMATAGGLSVSAPAEALESGQLGDVIRVVNLSSQREVKAVVTGKNSVTAQTNMR